MLIFLISLMIHLGSLSDCGTTLYQCDTCTIFQIQIVLNNTKCVEKCDKILYYQSEQSHICIPCDTSCSGCLGPLRNHCLNCSNSTKLLQNGICQNKCSVGYYDSQNTCLNCDVTCRSCFKFSTNCTSCSGSRYLYDNTCYNGNCPIKTYINQNLNQCVSDCPSGQFINKTSSACENCPLYCSLCRSTQNTQTQIYFGQVSSLIKYQCYQCKKNYYLFENKCYLNCPSYLHQNQMKNIWTCTYYLNFTIHANQFQSPLLNNSISTQIRYYVILFSEPVVDSKGHNITQIQLMNSITFLINNLNSQSVWFQIDNFEMSQKLHFEISVFDCFGQIIVTTIMTNESFRGGISGSPFSPNSFNQGVVQIFTGNSFINFKYAKYDDILYIFSSLIFVSTLILIFVLSLLFKVFVDPKNYVFFQFFYNMQILSMLVYIDVPRYQYLFLPFQILQIWFNFAINASLNKSTNYSTEQLYQWNIPIPSNQYPSNAIASAFNFNFMDPFLSKLYSPMIDFQMSCNYLANFFFYCGVLLIFTYVLMLVLKHFQDKNYLKQEDLQKQQLLRQKLTMFFKTSRILNIRVYQVLTLNNYFFVILQLAQPNFNDIFSGVSYIVALSSSFIQIWILYQFQRKMKKITDYQDNSSSFQEFILNYNMFFNGLKVSFNNVQNEEKESFLNEQTQKDQQDQQESVQREKQKLNATMEMIAIQKMTQEVDIYQEAQINRMQIQEDKMIEVQKRIYQQQLSNYYLILVYHVVSHIRMIATCFLIVLLQQQQKSYTFQLLGSLIFINILMIIYYIWIQPLQDLAANIHQIYFELSMAMITACFIFLSTVFNDFQSYVSIPLSQQDRMNISIIIIIVLLYGLIFSYIITTFAVSLPYIKLTSLKNKPKPIIIPPLLAVFNPNIGPKIDLGGIIYDHSKVQELQIELSQQNVQNNISKNIINKIKYESMLEWVQKSFRKIMQKKQNVKQISRNQIERRRNKRNICKNKNRTRITMNNIIRYYENLFDQNYTLL